jgi:hypothetical protein
VFSQVGSQVRICFALGGFHHLTDQEAQHRLLGVPNWCARPTLANWLAATARLLHRPIKAPVSPRNRGFDPVPG